MESDEIKEKANILFSPLFPGIKCEEPVLESHTLRIPFTWGLLSRGLMVFEDCNLDPFRCRPFQFEDSTDWIKMKYLTKESAISEMEAFLRSKITQPL
jgi:hypothetical protein